MHALTPRGAGCGGSRRRRRGGERRLSPARTPQGVLFCYRYTFQLYVTTRKRAAKMRERERRGGQVRSDVVRGS
eukprot:3244483-Rhodomonas_salina.1